LLSKGVKADVKLRITPLEAAAYGGHIDIVELLLAHEADLKAQNYISLLESTLVAAIDGNQIDCVAFILNHVKESSRVLNNAHTPHNNTMLGLAVLKGNHKIVKILLEKGADINAISNNSTPLFTAVSLNDSTMVKLLLQHKANTEQSTETKPTPLSTAALMGNTEIVHRPWCQC
jgi:ankyrin repeat protein